jgi:hypothetical protein
MGKREPQTIVDRSIHLEIRAMANSPRNQPVASKLWLSSRATNRGRGKCGRWVLKE